MDQRGWKGEWALIEKRNKKKKKIELKIADPACFPDGPLDWPIRRRRQRAAGAKIYVCLCGNEVQTVKKKFFAPTRYSMVLSSFEES